MITLNKFIIIAYCDFYIASYIAFSVFTDSGKKVLPE